MRQPHVRWGVASKDIFNSRDLFVDEKKVGRFHGYVEDASQTSIDKVLDELCARGVIRYDGLPE